MTDWVTIEDFAVLAGVKRQTIRQYRKRGILPEPDRWFGRTPVWRRGIVDQWVEDRRPPGNPAWRKTPA